MSPLPFSFGAFRAFNEHALIDHRLRAKLAITPGGFMLEYLVVFIAILALSILILVIIIVRRGGQLKDAGGELPEVEKAIRDGEKETREELGRHRTEAAEQSRQLRQEITGSVSSNFDLISRNLSEGSQSQTQRLDIFSGQLTKMIESNQENARLIREEVAQSIKSLGESSLLQLKESADTQKERLSTFSQGLTDFNTSVDKRLKDVQESGEKCLVDIRNELSLQTTKLKEETVQSLTIFTNQTSTKLQSVAELQKEQLTGFATRLSELATQTDLKLEGTRVLIDKRLGAIQDANDKRLVEMREETRVSAQASRNEITTAMKDFQTSVKTLLSEQAQYSRNQISDFTTRLGEIATNNDKKMDSLRGIVDQRLKEMNVDNTNKLEEMRKTVDEKLESTLEKRLGESFKQVSERLEQVHAGLGEMKTLASGVGDLKKVLSNVKTRGTWGEVQLGNLLEQIFTLEQYSKNVATRPGSNERVEFAIKLPGRNEDFDQPFWLPIDAKFPQEDYQRLVDASERADTDGVKESLKQLELRIRGCAKDISEKYVCPPHTTDFAILFLPTEGLYAEVLRIPGLVDSLQRDTRIIVAGPTTLFAILNSLQMGFRTLAIEKRSSEVWKVLGAVKTEFDKFGVAFNKVKKKLGEASDAIDDANKRTRAMQKTLVNVDKLPIAEASNALGLPVAAIEGALAEADSEPDDI